MASKQTPLAKRGGDPHDFRQSAADWEASIFDEAEYYFVLRLRSSPRRLRDEFPTFHDAVKHARRYPDEGACVYAVTPSGRSTILDEDVWDQWMERELTSRGA